MFKKDKNGSKDSGKRKWALLGVIATVAILGAGVVLAVTYWPAKSADLKKSFEQGATSLSIEEGKSRSVISSFISQNIAQMTQKANEDTSEEDQKEGYVAEMESFSSITSAVATSLNFYSNTIESAMKGKLNRRSVKEISSRLKDSETRLSEMSSHINLHKDELTNFTVVLSVWEGVRESYKELLSDYVKTYQLLTDLYQNQELSGIYGNEVMELSVKAMYSYLDVIYQNLFEKDASYEVATLSSQNLANFSSSYDMSFSSLNSSKIANITNYYKSETCQKNATYISKLEKETDKKVDFKYLIKNNFDVSDLALTQATQKYVDPSVAFLKGFDLTNTDYVGELPQATQRTLKGGF